MAHCSTGHEKSYQSNASLLNVRNFHSWILRTDSELLALDESRESMVRKNRTLQKSLGQYTDVAKTICRLLYDFGMFEFDERWDNASGHGATITERFVNMDEVVTVIKKTAFIQLRSIIMKENVDAEISEEFLKVI